MSLTTTMGKPSQHPEPIDEITANLISLGNPYLGQTHFCPSRDEALGRDAAQGLWGAAALGELGL